MGAQDDRDIFLSRNSDECLLSQPAPLKEEAMLSKVVRKGGAASMPLGPEQPL